MPQPKGHTGNPNGRPKGKPNRVNGELRTFIQKLIDQNRKQIIIDLGKIDAKDRLNLIVKLMDFVLPKLSSGSLSLDIQRLPESDLDRIINELNKSISNEPESKD
jgi:hypothetical protein